MVVLLVAALIVGPVTPASARPDPAGLDWRGMLAARGPDPVPPPPRPVRSAPPAGSQPAPASPLVTLPAPATAEVSLATEARRAGSAPVSVAAGSAAVAGRRLGVAVLDQDTAARAAVSGFVFRLSGVDGAPLGKGPLPVTVSVDYAGFAERFGGGYADRLRIVALPACALSAAPDAACVRRVAAVPYRNERQAARLVAEVGDLTAFGSAEAIFAVTAGPDGEEGTYAATQLELSGDWQVTPGSGNFTYSYQVPLPAAPAGPTPQVELRYSSGAVDGLVSGRNTQSGQVGLGWGDFGNAFIERRYNSCRNDGQGTSDLCWKSDNATISLNGRSGELVAVPGSNPKQWRLRDDPRWRIEQLSGADNGDDNGEHWRVTSPDGVHYFFGLGVNPDVGVHTNSVWTVPVIGDDPGEPCSTNQPVAWCPQAWRWNLDLVVDPHDNVQQFEYHKEIEHYSALNGQPGFEHTAYVRSGALQLIKYGKRRVGSETTPAAMVRFTTDYRCLALNHTCAAPTAATASDYPDTPVDLMCFTATCEQHTPAFFTTLRYSEITTSVNNGPDDGPFVEVDEIALAHGLPDPDPNRTGDRKLYLNSVQRTGLTGPTGITLPAVTFFPVLLNNRIDTAGGLSSMPHYRVGAVTNEYGGQVRVSYGEPHPCPNPVPNPPNWDRNTRDCFPNWHSPEGGTAGFAVFRKHLVTRIEEHDGLGGGPAMVTTYRYGDQVQAGLPNAAWHHDRDEYTPLDRQTWSEWRGYADVVVSAGESRTQYRLFRGMNNDRIAGDRFPGPGSRAARVSSLDGTVTNLPDENRLAGQILDEQSLRANGTVESGTVHGYFSLRTVDVAGLDPLDDAWFVAENDTIERRRSPANGSYLRKRTQTVHNGLFGTVDRVVEHGWTTVSGDERCTVTVPVVDVNRWMLDYSASVTRHANATCDGPEVSRTENAYDGQAFGAAPTRGDLTGSRAKINAAGAWATTTTTYDRLGRPLAVTDPNGHTTTTRHTPDIRYPATTTVTNHLGQVTTTDLFRPRQLPTAQTDARGKRTTFTHDALGRTVEVRKATEQATNAPASYQFHYEISPDRTAPPVVRTRVLQDTRYVDTWIVHDSWMRARQTHKLSPAAGRVIVTNTTYDNRGLTAATSLPQALPGSPGLGVLPAPGGGWANETATSYDELRRPVRQTAFVAGANRRSVVTEYTHDTTTTRPEPPAGGVSRTVRDAYDRIARVEELDGGTWRSTSYGYDAADRLTTVRDPAGNTATNTYDLAGRKTTMADPDAGTWTYGYDAAGNQTRTTSGSGVTLVTGYDALNRKTAVRRDTASGPLLARWDYDAPGEAGLLDRSTRFEPTGAWVLDIAGYDDRGRPTARTWTVPAGVAGLAGSYTVGYGYDAADHQTRAVFPAVGGLPAETVTTAYTALGLPDTVVGAAEYVWATNYDDRARPAWVLSGSRTVPFNRIRDHDTDQRVSRLRAGGGNTTSQDIQFGYDTTFGDVVERTVTLGGQTTRECYGHDDLRRLTRAFTTAGSCPAGAPGTGAAPYNHTYQYGPDGNLTRRVEGATTIAYGYPAAGAPRPHAPTSVGADTYTWTPDGDLAGRTVGGRTATLSWTAERRLALVRESGGDTTFGYDADGNRVLRQSPAGTTLYIDNHEITRTPAGSTTAVRTYNIESVPTAIRTPAGVEFLATDNQGSVQLTVPSGGTTPTRVRSYQPYGWPRTSDRTSTDRAWLGQFEDQTTGLDYLNNRYYDPAIGRFISPDPLFDTERPQTVNPYAYGINNPTTFTDPSGLVALDCISGASGCTRPGKSWGVAPRPPASPVPCAQGFVRTSSGCRADILAGPLNWNGPPMSQSDLDELMTTVNEVRNIDAEESADMGGGIGAGGPCGEAHSSAGRFVGGAACVTWDGDKYTVLAMVEWGAGTTHTGAGLSGMISNAESHEDLEGNAWCVGGSVGGEGVVAGGEVCVGYTDDWSEQTGIWTAAVQGGAGTSEFHVTAVHTYEVFSLDPNSIPNPLSPAMDAIGDGLNSLRCIPNRC